MLKFSGQNLNKDKKLKILVLDFHRPEFFSESIVRELRTLGHSVALVSQIPRDIANVDVILCLYLSEQLRDLSHLLCTVPVVALAMGTDVLVKSWEGTNWQTIDKVLVCNSEHLDILKKAAPAANTRLTSWFADESKLLTKDRTFPKIVNNKVSNLSLCNIALHQYSKGLDNVVQMLADAGDVVELSSFTLHVIGSVGPYQDYNQYLYYWLSWFTQSQDGNDPLCGFKVIYHGAIHPKAIDSVVESIQPHGYIHGSQGECGATVAMEALIKGLPVFMQDHPFRKAVYRDSLPGLFTFKTGKELVAQIKRCYTSTSPLTELNRTQAIREFGISNIVRDIEQELKAAIVRKG